MRRKQHSAQLDGIGTFYTDGRGGTAASLGAYSRTTAWGKKHRVFQASLLLWAPAIPVGLIPLWLPQKIVEGLNPSTWEIPARLRVVKQLKEALGCEELIYQPPKGIYLRGGLTIADSFRREWVLQALDFAQRALEELLPRAAWGVRNYN